MRSSGEFISVQSKELVLQHKKAEAAVFPQASVGVTLEATCFVENNMKETQSVLTTTLASPISTILSVTSECNAAAAAANGTLNIPLAINTSTGQTLLPPVTNITPSAALNNININNLSSVPSHHAGTGSSRLLGSGTVEKNCSDSNGSERESPNSSFLIDVDSDESKLSPTGSMPVSLLDPNNKLVQPSSAVAPALSLSNLRRQDERLKLKIKNPRSKPNGRSQPLPPPEGGGTGAASPNSLSEATTKVSSIANGLTNGTGGLHINNSTEQSVHDANQNLTDKGKKSRKRPYEKKEKAPRKPASAKGKGGKAKTAATTAALNGNELDLEPPAKKSKTDRHSSGSQDAGTGTCSVSTFTEPDLIGPLEPGTPVTLEGIVWHESVTKGFVVVNITWRGKTYMGTLMDYAQLEWAPPRHCDSPPSDIDSTRSPAKDKTVKRSRNGVLGLTEGDLTSQLRGGKTRRGANFQTPASPARSDASSGKRKGRVPNTTKSSTAPDNNAPSDLLPCVTDEGKAKRGRRAASGPSTPSSEQPTPSSASPPLLECPEANCSKKFPNLNALRFHQQDQHSRLVEDDRSCDSQPETRCSSESANAPSHAVPLTTESSNSSLFSKSDMDSLTAMQLQLVSATTHQPAKPDASKAVLPEITPTSNTNAMPISVPSATVATLQNPSVSSDPALKAVLEPTLAAPLSNSDNAARGEDSVETDNKADKQRNSGRRKQSRPCLSEQKGSTTKENTTVSEKNNRPSETSVLDVLRGKKPAADLLEPVKKQSKVGSSGSKPDASYDSDSSESALTEEQARNIVTAKLDPTMLDTLKSLGIRPFGVSSSISAEVNNPAVKTAVAMCQKLGNRIRDPEIPHTSAKNASLNRPLDLKITPSAAPTSPLVTTVKTQEHPERTESAYSDISDDGDDVKPDKDIEMPSVPTTPISSASDRPPYLGFFPSSPFLLQGLGEPDGKRSSPSELPKKMPFAPYVYGGLPIASPDHFANSGLTFPNILEFPPNRSEADSKARPTDPGADAGPSGSAVKTPGRSTEAKAIKEETVKGDKGEGKCKSPSVKETSKVPLEAKNEPVKPKEEMAKAVSPVANKLPPANPPLYAQPPYLPPPGFRPGMPPGGYPPPNHPLYMGPRPLFPQDQMQFLNMMYGYGMQRGGPMPPGMPPLGEPLPYDLQQRLYSPGQFTHKIHELTATKEGNNKNTPPTSASSILSENKKPVMQSQENVKKAGEAPAVKGSRPVKTGLADGRLDRVNLEQASSQSRRGAGPHPSGASASALGPDVPAAHTVDSHQAFASQKPPTLHLPSSNSN